jgi:hypothetical protein
MGEVSRGRFEARVRELAVEQAMLERSVTPMLRACEALRSEYGRPHRDMLAIVKHDAVCRRLMTVPGVGALVAVTFKSAVDDPGRFAKSKAVGAHFGLTPRKSQSGETNVTGISRVGDAMVRTASTRPRISSSAALSVFQPEALGSGLGQAARPETHQGRPRPRPFCIACGSTERLPLGQESRHGRVTEERACAGGLRRSV